MIKEYYIDKNIKDKFKKNIACIGFFDGVHLGHQALIRKTVELAKEKNLEPNLITFYPDPDEVLGKNNVFHINTLKQRVKLIEKHNIKNIVIINFDENFSKVSDKDFVIEYLNKMNIDTLITGFDFHYGNKGKGDVLSLKKSKERNFDVISIDEVKYYNKKISSTRIRKAIKDKKYNLANKMLGYRYK